MTTLLRKLAFVSLVLGGCFATEPLFGHSGGLDSQGCHTNRKTGEYHCHRAPAKAPPPSSDEPQPEGQTYYRNCTEVRAAGKAPLKRGQPGYASHLDRDNDGIACETN